MAGSTPFRKRRSRQPELTAGPAADAPGDMVDANVERGRTASLAAAVVGRGVETVKQGGRGARAGLTAVADRIIINAPRIPVRDLDTLRAQFPGLGPEQIADKLVAGAAYGTSTVGAGVGAAAMLPVPPAMPAELAAEIVGVAAVEFKLIAELHEIYGIRAPGNTRQRAMAYLAAWADERGIDVTSPLSVNAALGIQLKRELRQQILKRTVRNLPTLTPFMIGATVGAVMNRRDTKRLADKVRKDLRTRQVPWHELPAAPSGPSEQGLGLA
ncbi:hypothetical protein [Streptomyces griseocarneus]|uniref:hypothetical protein n=1 Tax=Streptomyces griseocarneus TaxID=51201 RepID=UPI00167D87E2|nr:hypothetical protein [Streptomyces griseocarneus]MBZ6472451.1 hypothetical protein [Streptomyces griseocarneus]GHG45242.1 hypothetical protein GCM10018779_01010 [Streptomyces griseocarneus]